MKRYFSILLVFLILVFVGVGVYSNILQQKAVDQSKLPEKVEDNNGFQRWITNLKNKDIEIEADEFRLKEENEIYNSKWMKVLSADTPENQALLEAELEEAQDTEMVIFSPSGREFLDFRNIPKKGYKANEVRFFGKKDSKIIDARVVDCSTSANCYFDRAYFLDNDVFIISEVSRTVDSDDPDYTGCLKSETCEYTFKVHVIDLINNQRLVYESKPFEAVLDNLIPEL